MWTHKTYFPVAYISSHTLLIILLFCHTLWITLSSCVLIVTWETVFQTWYSGMFIICFPQIIHTTNFGYCHQIYSDTFCMSHVPCINEMYKIFKKTGNIVCSVYCVKLHSYCITQYMLCTKLNFTISDSFCWPTLLESIHCAPQRWPFKGSKHVGVTCGINKVVI
jgi:hypothetical protein